MFNCISLPFKFLVQKKFWVWYSKDHWKPIPNWPWGCSKKWITILFGFLFKEAADSGCGLLASLGSSRRPRFVSCSLLCPQGPAPCLAQRRHSGNICWTVLFNFITLTGQSTYKLTVQRKSLFSWTKRKEKQMRVSTDSTVQSFWTFFPPP